MKPTISPQELAKRGEALRESMRRNKLDGVLLTREENVRYMSGFTGQDSLLLVGLNSLVLMTDFRYIEEAEQTCPHATVRQHSNGMMRTVAAEAKKRRIRRLAYDPQMLTVTKTDMLKSHLTRTRAVKKTGLVETLRLIKSPAEVKAIEACLRIAEKAFKSLWRRLKPGITESEAAAELEYLMRRRFGASGPAFDTIVAFDERASQPHAKPGRKKLRKSSIVLVDWGARADFYNSDLTRTRAIGRIPRKFAEVRDIVAEAQKRAIEAVRPGVSLRSVDAVARSFIASEGFGKAFGHGLGHGVGLEIHEGPALSPRSKGNLEPGMVVTVEPGIYLPGELGIRIEDMVLVTEDGSRVLSNLAH